jgi:hypothetical protein
LEQDGAVFGQASDLVSQQLGASGVVEVEQQPVVRLREVNVFRDRPLSSPGTEAVGELRRRLRRERVWSRSGPYPPLCRREDDAPSGHSRKKWKRCGGPPVKWAQLHASIGRDVEQKADDGRCVERVEHVTLDDLHMDITSRPADIETIGTYADHEFV